MRQVRQRGQNLAQARVGVSRFLFARLNLFAQVFGLLDLRRGILPAFLELGNLFGSAVALRLQSLGLGDGLAALSVNGVKIFQDFRWIHTTLAQLFLDQREVVADKV